MSRETAIWLDNREFRVCYPPSTRWRELPGVYIFAGVNQDDEWHPLYVGQTESLAKRLATHEKWLAAELRGATHIHARVVSDRERRLWLEKELVVRYQPLLNQ